MGVVRVALWAVAHPLLSLLWTDWFRRQACPIHVIGRPHERKSCSFLLSSVQRSECETPLPLCLSY